MTTATLTLAGPHAPIFRPVTTNTAISRPAHDRNKVRYLDEQMFSDIGMSVSGCVRIRDFFTSPE